MGTHHPDGDDVRGIAKFLNRNIKRSVLDLLSNYPTALKRQSKNPILLIVSVLLGLSFAVYESILDLRGERVRTGEFVHLILVWVVLLALSHFVWFGNRWAVILSMILQTMTVLGVTAVYSIFDQLNSYMLVRLIMPCSSLLLCWIYLVQDNLDRKTRLSSN